MVFIFRPIKIEGQEEARASSFAQQLSCGSARRAIANQCIGVAHRGGQAFFAVERNVAWERLVVATHHHVQTVDNGVAASPVAKEHWIFAHGTCSSRSQLAWRIQILVHHHIKAQQLADNAIGVQRFNRVENWTTIGVLQATNGLCKNRTNHELGAFGPVLLWQSVNRIDDVFVHNRIGANGVDVGSQLVISSQAMQPAWN